MADALHPQTCSVTDANGVDRRGLPVQAVVETMQSEMLSNPGSLVGLVRSRWPDLWARIIAEARRQGWSPVQQLIFTIEEGLAKNG